MEQKNEKTFMSHGKIKVTSESRKFKKFTHMSIRMRPLHSKHRRAIIRNNSILNHQRPFSEIQASVGHQILALAYTRVTSYCPFGSNNTCNALQT